MKKILLSALALVALASCNKEKNYPVVPNDGSVSFTSGISTRASGTTWHKGDQIGVFMDGATVVEENANVLYTNDSEDGATASFNSVNPLKYPETGSVNFLAYYPYAATATTTEYAVNVQDQSDLTLIDLMVATTSDVAVYTSPVDMTFSHKLSNIAITLTEGNGFDADTKPFDNNFEVTITGVNTVAKYNLTSGEITDISTPTTLLLNGSGATHQGVIIPQTTTTVNVVITHPEYGVFESVITGVEFLSGKKHPYTAKINALDRSIQMVGATITDWVSVENEDITAEQAKTPFTTSVSDENAKVHYITSADDLRLLSTMINGSTGVTYQGVLFVVTDDIDLEGVQFTAIGSKTASKSFQGILDGNYKTISGLYASGAAFQGLIGYALDATIKNLTVEGNVTGTGGNVSGIICLAERSVVMNCHNKVTVEGGAFAVGGVVANNNGSQIENCVNSGNVTGTANATAVGGVAGNNTGATNKSFSVLNCYNSGTISGVKSQIGGVAGNVGANGNFSGTFTNCYNVGAITVELSTTEVGAVAGKVATDKAKINNCYYNSEVTPGVAGALVPKDSAADPIVTEEKATARTTVEMKDATFITALNAVVWAADASNNNSGYPILTTIKY